VTATDDVLQQMLERAEKDVEQAKRLWYAARPEQQSAAYAKYLAALQWLTYLREKVKA
jgi:hypothetical protein